MHCFYLSNRNAGDNKGGQAMPTKEFQRRRREMGKSVNGSRQDLIKRHDKVMPQGTLDGEREEDNKSPPNPMPRHASGHPTMVMVDESAGNKYISAVEHKWLEGKGDNNWLVRGKHDELKS